MNKEIKSSVIKPAKPLAKVNSASGKPKHKRTNSEASLNSTMEEINLLSHQMEGMTEDLKSIRENLNSVLKKDEMEDFIKQTISTIISELNENMEMTISNKVEEKTKDLQNQIVSLVDGNKSLRQQLKSFSAKIENCETRSKSAMSKSNYNEQYSRKNNVKLMELKESSTETEDSLISEVNKLFQKKGVTIAPHHIQAIHRIPGKVGHPKPLLIKFNNNNQKTKVMLHRSAFKAIGNRLVDDVTSLNVDLMKRLTEHPAITQAWYFNGSVYGKTSNDKRYKFDLYDKVDDVLSGKKK